MKHTIAAALALAAATLATPAAAQGTCDRAFLQNVTDSYLAAITESTAFKMNLGEWVEFWRNMDRGSMSEFFDVQREVVSYKALFDTTACKAYVETTVQEADGRRIVAAQVTNGFFGISPISVIVPAIAPAGSEGGQWPAAVEGQTRAQLSAAADAYLETVGAAPQIDRQYVVDETYGAITVFTKAGADQKAQSFTFFLKDGQIASQSAIPQQ